MKNITIFREDFQKRLDEQRKKIEDSLIRLKSGDPQAWLILRKDIRRRVRYMMDKLVFDSSVDEDDICQIVITEVYTSIDTFHYRSSFSTWVHKIISNTMIDHNRRLTSWKRTCVYDSAVLGFSLDLVDSVSNDELFTLIHDLLKDKPEIWWQVFVLTYINQVNQKEMSKIFNVSQPYISKVRKQVLSYLRQCQEMLDWGYEEGFLDKNDLYDQDENCK